MRGHDTIIAARMSGRAPGFVFVNDYPCKTDWFENGEHATVCTHGDALSSLDWRFLVGLQVSISSPDEQRAKTLFKQIKQCGATTIAACHVQRSQHAIDQSGWASVWHKEMEYA